MSASVSPQVGGRRGWDEGFFWTGHPIEESGSPRLDDSYYGDYATLWDLRQQERNAELDIDGEDVDLPLIKGVVQGHKYNDITAPANRIFQVCYLWKYFCYQRTAPILRST